MSFFIFYFPLPFHSFLNSPIFIFVVRTHIYTCISSPLFYTRIILYMPRKKKDAYFCVLS